MTPDPLRVATRKAVANGHTPAPPDRRRSEVRAAMRPLGGHDAGLLDTDNANANANANVSVLHLHDQATAPGGVLRFKRILAQIEGRLAGWPAGRLAGWPAGRLAAVPPAAAGGAGSPVLGGRRRLCARYLRTQDMAACVRQATAKCGVVPSWAGRRLPLSHELADATPTVLEPAAGPQRLRRAQR